MRGLGEVPSDYGAPYSGVIFAPYTGQGPLGDAAPDAPAPKLYGRTLARAQFLTWLRTFNPALFEAAVKQAEDWKASLASPTALSGLGADDSEPSTWWQQLTEGLTSMGTAYLAYKGQQQVLQTNIQRAQMGLPPIDPSTGAPTVRTQVSLSPQLLSRLGDGGTMVLYAGLGLAALYLLTNVFGGRRGRR